MLSKVFDNFLFVHQEDTYWTLYMLLCIFLLFLCQVLCCNMDFYLKNVIKALCSSVHRNSFLRLHTNTLYNKFVVSKWKGRKVTFKPGTISGVNSVQNLCCRVGVIFCQVGHSVAKAQAFYITCSLESCWGSGTGSRLTDLVCRRASGVSLAK